MAKAFKALVEMHQSPKTQKRRLAHNFRFNQLMRPAFYALHKMVLCKQIGAHLSN